MNKEELNKIKMRFEATTIAPLCIRELEIHAYPILEEFLFQAIYIPEGDLPPDKSIIFQPELHRYVKDFGNNHDLGFVAESNKIIVGAIWTRLFTATEKGYGFVDSETPELSMSVNSGFRGNGIGTRLLEKMLAKLQESGYKKVSLSVDNRNFAHHLYLKFGFVEHKIEGNSVVMVKVFLNP